MRQGDIVLVDFGKSRDSFSFGKKRPAIIIQTDKLNFAVKEGLYTYYIVIPLSTKEDLLTQEFRVFISKREGLQKDSFAVCNSICFLSTRYIGPKIATLSDEELVKIKEVIKEVLDF